MTRHNLVSDQLLLSAQPSYQALSHEASPSGPSVPVPTPPASSNTPPLLEDCIIVEPSRIKETLNEAERSSSQFSRY